MPTDSRATLQSLLDATATGAICTLPDGAFHVGRNTFGDATAVQTVGISLDDGTHALQASDLAGNSYGTGVATGRL